MLKGMNHFNIDGMLKKLTPGEAEKIREEIEDAWEYPHKYPDRDYKKDLEFILTYLATKEYEDRQSLLRSTKIFTESVGV